MLSLSLGILLSELTCILSVLSLSHTRSHARALTPFQYTQSTFSIYTQNPTHISHITSVSLCNVCTGGIEGGNEILFIRIQSMLLTLSHAFKKSSLVTRRIKSSHSDTSYISNSLLNTYAFSQDYFFSSVVNARAFIIREPS